MVIPESIVCKVQEIFTCVRSHWVPNSYEVILGKIFFLTKINKHYAKTSFSLLYRHTESFISSGGIHNFQECITRSERKKANIFMDDFNYASNFVFSFPDLRL